MKALTLHQPWASLVALGVKTIETRSWSTSYRGRIAIHAGKTRMPLMHLPKLWSIGKTRDEQEQTNGLSWLFCNTITASEHLRPHRQGEKVPAWATTPTLFRPARGPHGQIWDETQGTSAVEQGSAILLPLGAIIATASLVDVVPMMQRMSSSTSSGPDPSDEPADDGALLLNGLYGHLWLWDSGTAVDVDDQRPFGDFAPGRFAWVLDEIEACEPVPARGWQGLWEWNR